MRRLPKLLLSVAWLPLLVWAAIPRFVDGGGPEPAVIETMRRLAATTRPVPGTPLVAMPDLDRYAYRVQATAAGVRVHAWPLEFDPAAPYLYFLDVDGSCWTSRNPSGNYVGIARPPALDGGAGPPVELDPRSASAGRVRRDPDGRVWDLERSQR